MPVSDVSEVCLAPLPLFRGVVWTPHVLLYLLVAINLDFHPGSWLDYRSCTQGEIDLACRARPGLG
jgi:hypothetical protein